MVRVLVLISGVNLLPASLYSTSTKSLQGHKHCFATWEPIQYPDGVTCFTSLHRKFFSSFAFYLFLFICSNKCAEALIDLMRQKRDPELLREK